jgi:hypothetical protein
MKTQQLELFETDEIETIELPPEEPTTIDDVIRELKSLSVEVDIALDQVFEEDLERTKETLENLVERLDKFLNDITL